MRILLLLTIITTFSIIGILDADGHQRQENMLDTDILCDTPYPYNWIPTTIVKDSVEEEYLECFKRIGELHAFLDKDNPRLRSPPHYFVDGELFTERSGVRTAINFDYVHVVNLSDVVSVSDSATVSKAFNISITDSVSITDSTTITKNDFIPSNTPKAVTATLIDLSNESTRNTDYIKSEIGKIKSGGGGVINKKIGYSLYHGMKPEPIPPLYPPYTEEWRQLYSKGELSRPEMLKLFYDLYVEIYHNNTRSDIG